MELTEAAAQSESPMVSSETTGHWPNPDPMRHIQLDLFGKVAADLAASASAHCVVRRAGIRYERRNRDQRVADENAVLWYGMCWSKEAQSEVGCWVNGKLIAVYVNGKRSEEARQAELEARGGVAPA